MCQRNDLEKRKRKLRSLRERERERSESEVRKLHSNLPVICLSLSEMIVSSSLANLENLCVKFYLLDRIA